jgi:hypothetical protein
MYAVPGEGGDRSVRPAPTAPRSRRLASRCHELLVSAGRLGQPRRPAHSPRRGELPRLGHRPPVRSRGARQRSPGMTRSCSLPRAWPPARRSPRTCSPCPGRKVSDPERQSRRGARRVGARGEAQPVGWPVRRRTGGCPSSAVEVDALRLAPGAHDIAGSRAHAQVLRGRGPARRRRTHGDVRPASTNSKQMSSPGPSLPAEDDEDVHTASSGA